MSKKKPLKRELVNEEVINIKRGVKEIIDSAYLALKSAWEAICEKSLCITEDMISIDAVIKIFLPKLAGDDNELVEYDHKSFLQEEGEGDIIVLGERCEVSRVELENYLKGYLCTNITSYSWNTSYKEMIDNDLVYETSKYCKKNSAEKAFECSEEFITYVWDVYNNCSNILPTVVKVESRGAPVRVVNIYHDDQNKAAVVEVGGNKAMLSLSNGYNKQIADSIQKDGGVAISSSNSSAELERGEGMVFNCKASFASQNDEYNECVRVSSQNHQRGRYPLLINQECNVARMSSKSAICKLYEVDDSNAHEEDVSSIKVSVNGKESSFKESLVNVLKYIVPGSAIIASALGGYRVNNPVQENPVQEVKDGWNEYGEGAPKLWDEGADSAMKGDYYDKNDNKHDSLSDVVSGEDIPKWWEGETDLPINNNQDDSYYKDEVAHYEENGIPKKEDREDEDFKEAGKYGYYKRSLLDKVRIWGDKVYSSGKLFVNDLKIGEMPLKYGIGVIGGVSVLIYATKMMMKSSEKSIIKDDSDVIRVNGGQDGVAIKVGGLVNTDHHSLKVSLNDIRGGFAISDLNTAYDKIDSGENQVKFWGMLIKSWHKPAAEAAAYNELECKYIYDDISGYYSCEVEIDHMKNESYAYGSVDC